jgi:hypothetical protein
MRSSEDYLRKAEELALKAEQALTPASRTQLNQLADAFLQLAERAENNRPPPGDQGAPTFTPSGRRGAFLQWLTPLMRGA